MSQLDGTPAAEVVGLVACLYCGAEVGQECRTAMGTIDRTGNPHSQRITAFRRYRKRHPATDSNGQTLQQQLDVGNAWTGDGRDRPPILRGPDRRQRQAPEWLGWESQDRRKGQRRDDYLGTCFCGATFTDPAAFDAHLRAEMAREDQAGRFAL